MFTHVGPPVPLVDLRATTRNGIRHYAAPNGNSYPSVTTVLGHKEKPWLVNWQKMLGEDNAARETKRCADRGTFVFRKQHYGMKV